MRVRPGDEWSSLVDGLAGLPSVIQLPASSCRIVHFSLPIWPAALARPVLSDAPHLSPPTVSLRFLRSRSRVAAARWLDTNRLGEASHYQNESVASLDQNQRSQETFSERWSASHLGTHASRSLFVMEGGAGHSRSAPPRIQQSSV
jgi:hypothetical protein